MSKKILRQRHHIQLKAVNFVKQAWGSEGVLGPLQCQSGEKLYLLEDSNLLHCDGPFVFGSHIGEYVWFYSGETETKYSEINIH